MRLARPSSSITAVVLLAVVCVASAALAQEPASLPLKPGTLDEAHRAYYNGRYEASAAMTLD